MTARGDAGLTPITKRKAAGVAAGDAKYGGSGGTRAGELATVTRPTQPPRPRARGGHAAASALRVAGGAIWVSGIGRA